MNRDRLTEWMSHMYWLGHAHGRTQGDHNMDHLERNRMLASALTELLGDPERFRVDV